MSTEEPSKDEQPSPTAQPAETSRQGMLARKLEDFQWWAHTRLPTIVRSPHHKQDWEYYRNRDAAENASTRPPPSENVRVVCLWAVELYGPSSSQRLLDGMEKLGWDQNPHAWPYTPTQWVREQRGFGGHSGSFDKLDLGVVGLRGSRYSAPLPDGVEFAVVSLGQITSSLTYVLVRFQFLSSTSSHYLDTLSEDRETTIRPNRRGYSILGVNNLKREEIRSHRQRCVARRTLGFTATCRGNSRAEVCPANSRL